MKNLRNQHKLKDENPNTRKTKRTMTLIIIGTVIGTVILVFVIAFLMYKQPWAQVTYKYDVGFLGKLSATKIKIPVDDFYKIKVDMQQGQAGTLKCVVDGAKTTSEYEFRFSNSQMSDEDSHLLFGGDYTLSCDYHINSSDDSVAWLIGPSIEYALTLERGM